MPRINRIRVNNVKYNFGTQFYDDFMMRFSCKNAIYDLANGGGKSVLMLLLLQNLIPNCTLDEKQPVEKLFRTSSGSNTIHSLIEWKLDSCYMRDNYKYMTTGFCARRGRDNGEDENRESANIEYFNYCIFYREFGDNDIKNLPLSKDGERITYNGLKSYLRDLEHKDHGVEVHIFERKGDYQSFISEYGLFESEWEIIRGINKTEGHVRTYFENNYKTGRKVVEDLLIEEIIQKSFQNQIGNSDDEEGMAKTLLDIKDRIIELTRRKEEISTFDRQIELMNELSEKILSFEEYQKNKDELKDELFNKLAICRRLKLDIEDRLKKSEEEENRLDASYGNEDKLICVAKLIDEQNELTKLKALVEEYNNRIDALIEKEKEINEKINLAECADAYKDIKKYEALKAEVVLAINNRMRDEGDIYEELKSLSGEAHERIESMKEENDRRLDAIKKEALVLKEEYERVKNAREESEVEEAVSERVLADIDEKIADLEKNVKEYSLESGVIVAEQAAEELSKVNGKIADNGAYAEENSGKLENLRIKKEEIRQNRVELESDIRVLLHRQKDVSEKNNAEGYDTEKINALVKVYGEADVNRLTKNIYSLYKKSIKDIAELEIQISAKDDYATNLSQGRYMLDGHQYRRVEEYLFNTYGEDVMYGYDWFNTLMPAQQRDVFKRVPFIDYSFVVKGDFERIRDDINLRNISHSSYIVPVISEMILRDMRHAASTDYIVFGTKDLSFLKDAGKVAAEVDQVRNEQYTMQEQLKVLNRKRDVLWEDYLYMQGISKSLKEDYAKELEDISRELAEKREELSLLMEEEEKTAGEITFAEEQIRKNDEDTGKCMERADSLKKLISTGEELSKLYSERKEVALKREHNLRMAVSYRESVHNSYARWQAVENTGLEESGKNEALLREWKELFEPYYDENYKKTGEELSYEDIVLRFRGLSQAKNAQNADLADKKTLIGAYEENIEKNNRFIQKRGFTTEDIENEMKSWENMPVDRKVTEERLESVRKELSQVRRENEAQNAQMNRLEGSLAHAGGVIREKYGEFEFFECENTSQFIAEHTEAMKFIKEQIDMVRKDMKSLNAQLNDVTVIDRDIERMLRNSGINVPETININTEVTYESLDGYDRIQKEYDRLIRSEYRKKEEFAKDKRRITESLRECKAFDLAEEVERSVDVPEGVDEVILMASNIKDTCQCIELEKERVGKGIDDMERIKESFESRCIQTCANIKAELDRLPKLSKITLDNEVISMIGLNIPYVKEEFYKERMSAYIDDTVAFSENFKNDEERISYIKGRLSWKKLFSVIVADMNAIRLNLYKRERIKDQSRYLRYEEAVGSTGQSQGIYIQFLIAIINYISNINAAGREVSSIGKVIFIDNPFGAAKDIYIWEPIFKLLKTNHVQLIVPARGATPAITARFDVNYILGQKMVNGRQQTVVVDYRSQVQNEALEYTRLDYNQESLF